MGTILARGTFLQNFTFGTPVGDDAGTGFAQMPTELHIVRNEGTVPFVVYTLYVLPPQPAVCPSIH